MGHIRSSLEAGFGAAWRYSLAHPQPQEGVEIGQRGSSKQGQRRRNRRTMEAANRNTLALPADRSP